MVSKIKYFVLVLFLGISLSCFACGEEVIGIYGRPVQDDTTANGIYYGEGYKENSGNLFVGGISQSGPNPDDNDQRYKDFADKNQAIYVPTYYTNAMTLDALEVNNAARGIRNNINGLSSPALSDKQYDTIIGYSGGTTSVVTAMAEQNVKAKTLILISPMCGGLDTLAEPVSKYWYGQSETPTDDFDWRSEFEEKIQKIIDSGTKIVVIQSSDDTPILGSNYQYRFPKDMSQRIVLNTGDELKVNNVDLENSGKEGHIEIFFDYARNHLENGVYEQSDRQIPKSLLKKEFLDSLTNPLLSPYSGTSGSSSQNNEGTDETSGTSYVNKARDDLWLIDMFFDPSFINKIEHFNPAFDWAVKPPVPMYLPSGEQNTYGYDFIYLPGIEDHFTDTYLNWVATYLNSIGGGDNGGYGGLLLDEDRSGEDGW